MEPSSFAALRVAALRSPAFSMRVVQRQYSFVIMPTRSVSIRYRITGRNRATVIELDPHSGRLAFNESRELACYDEFTAIQWALNSAVEQPPLLRRDSRGHFPPAVHDGGTNPAASTHPNPRSGVHLARPLDCVMSS